MATVSFGNRQAKALCQMSLRERLKLISEGLPIIHESANSLWKAALQLKEHGREAAILEGLAEEEAAKALILLDVVRCPARCSHRMGPLLRCFYDHLGRMIYADAQRWRPVNFRQLKEYVDEARQGHYLEGYAGEYIVPNWNRYSRESRMYSDLEAFENGDLHWSDPSHFDGIGVAFQPRALDLLGSFQTVGLFRPEALIIANQLWDSTEFVNAENLDDSRQLGITLIEHLNRIGAISESATDRDIGLVVHEWQMPMYNLDFKELPADLEALKAERERAFWAEAGYHPAWG